ncbi:hypothetical protein G9C98_003163 [Cotesia typhae]|uniref:Protein phosphatase methylesterase 1 n=1 Tax=Cotesia typhae TaxID=2053667 RepID=A0A8J5RD42_9HYME|nr:hypothetical protein G9C98_003163 [Cotesia typhae]
MSALQKSVLKSKLPPSGIDFTSTRSCKARALQRKRDYDPVEWTPFFDESKDVVIGENTFHIYTKGNEGPTLVLLHGGGYSALTWAEFTKSITSMIICRVLAMDLRGHGDTHTTDDENLSANTLAMDVAAVIKQVTENNPVILVGHSMGGAVAVRAAEHIENLAGLTVIDVVEGTAMDALTSMQRQIKNNETNKLATHDIKDALESSVAHSTENLSVTIERDDIIPEDEVVGDDHDEDDDEKKHKLPVATKDFTTQNKKYSWRINLSKTENHWSGWFKGLSTAFLNAPAPKLLLLAGIDRLDRELTVGQMQGKFQMQVLPACGHAVHEDVPDKVAEAIATFMVRNKFAEPASDFHRVFPAC